MKIRGILRVFTALYRGFFDGKFWQVFSRSNSFLLSISVNSMTWTFKKKKGEGSVGTSDQLFERIVFRSQDIKDMHVLNPLPPGCVCGEGVCGCMCVCKGGGG